LRGWEMKSAPVRSVWLLFVPCFCVAVIPAHGDTHYASKSGSNTPPYTSWETASSSIQSAIDAASEGDTVLIGPGTFEESIVMKGGVVLSGAGAELTIIDGTRGPLVTCVGATGSAIENLTITGGGTSGSGGGIYIEDSDRLTIRNCAIRGNYAEYRKAAAYPAQRLEAPAQKRPITSAELDYGHYEESGGGIFALSSEVTIEDCVVEKNVAGWAGGGIFLGCSGKVCKITRCEVIGNTARTGPGGGIACYCLGEIADCVVANNVAEGDGGGVWCGDTVGIRRCLVYNNSAGTPYTYEYEQCGGGVFYGGGPEKGIINCVIVGNWALRGSGIFWEANANVVNCTILFNTAGKGFGAIEVALPAQIYGTYENITNCIVHSHGYYEDRAVWRATYSAVSSKYHREGEGNIWEDTIVGAFRVHGRIKVQSVVYDPQRDMTMVLCREGIGEDDQYRHMFADTRTPRFLIAGNAGNEVVCHGQVDPKVVGATFEITDFSLSADSPCIDAGNNEADYLPEEDKTGAFRVYRGRDQWRVDMGAYEYNSRRFGIAAIHPTAEPGEVKITWNSQPLPGKTYSLHLSSDLANWTLGGSNIPPQADLTSWIDPSFGAFRRRFYRVSSP